jgi:hypothetical protein
MQNAFDSTLTHVKTYTPPINYNPSTWQFDVDSPKANTNVSPVWRMAYMYTIYQLVLVFIVLAFPRFLPEWVKDYVRATSVFIAIGWYGLYMYLGPDKIYSLYAFLLPSVNRDAFMVMDVLIHAIPLIILGPPHNPISYIVAFFAITIWYNTTRLILPGVYNLLPVSESNTVFYLIGPILALVLYTISIHRRRHQ